MNPTSDTPHVIGELINNSYGRARRAWLERDVDRYRTLAERQTALGACRLTFNLDGTRNLSVSLAEMLEFLPRVLPAIQEVTRLPLSFDSPDVAFHREALRHYDRSRCDGRPILNSLAASRHNIAEMIDVAAENEMDVIVMASECFNTDGQHRAARTAQDILDAALHFSDLLRQQADFSNDRIIIDPGLCPIASDTVGGVQLCLDGIRLIRECDDLAGIHISIGLSNFSIGSPATMRIPLERAILRLALDAGLDYVLANPEKNTAPLAAEAPLVRGLLEVLETGRPLPDEDPEEAGFRQLDALMELWNDSAIITNF